MPLLHISTGLSGKNMFVDLLLTILCCLQQTTGVISFFLFLFCFVVSSLPRAGIKLMASGILGKHSINWAISATVVLFFRLLILVCIFLEGNFALLFGLKTISGERATQSGLRWWGVIVMYFLQSNSLRKLACLSTFTFCVLFFL